MIMAESGAPGGEHRGLRKAAMAASITVAGALVLLKLIAWIHTDSVALMASLIDSSMDLVASSVALMGVLTAALPPDPDHRYGHGKAEPLAALAQAAFIAGSAVILCYEAIRHLVEPRPITPPTWGVAVMAFSIALTTALLLFQRYVVRRTGSIAVGADQLHYKGDLLLNLAVIAALLLSSWTGIARLDPLFALGVSAFLILGARRLARRALGILMDRELPDDQRARIQAIVNAHPEALGMHDLRTRHSGEVEIIEMHLELDGDLSLHQAHDIADAIENELRAAYPGCEVLVHQEPHGLDDERLDDRVR